MGKVDELPQLEVTRRAGWRAWLEAHHEQTAGIWVVTFKKHCGDRHVPWPDLVQEAICFGWIDCRTRRVDEDRTSVLMTRRKPGSVWSALNKRHVAELEARGLLAPAGRAVIEAARRDGSWAFLDDIDALRVPDDLEAALRSKSQRSAWDTAPENLRKRALYEVKTAKQPTTRSQRIDRIVARLAAGDPPV